MHKQIEIDCESINHYLTKDQLGALQLALAKEKKNFGALDGYRFEKLLMHVLPNCKRAVHLDPRRVTNTRDKKWFDLKQPYRGIEVKTYQTSTSRIMHKTIVRNVLKRIPPDALPDKLVTIRGEERQVKRDVKAGEVGSAVLGYMKETLQQHAKEKGIPDRWDFAVLFRNPEFTQVGYWEEPIDFGDPSDYYWEWRDLSLIGSRDNDVFFTWYFANQRQLFYRFCAPQDVQVFEIPDVRILSLTEDELQKMLDESYHKGYEDGIKKSK